MSARPIIFSSEMVLAVLDGRKTQTRRVIKPQPEAALSRIEHSDLWTYTLYDRKWRCPYGQPRATLWVREGYFNGVGGGLAPGLHYRADHPHIDIPWRSPIRMPRHFSRITLEITGVRVERVQDISEVDAKAEGCPDTHLLTPERDDYFGLYARDEFPKIWDSLNKKRGYGWDLNPFVWIIEFKRVEEGKG